MNKDELIKNIKGWSSYIEDNEAEEFYRIIKAVIDGGCPEDVAISAIEDAYHTTASMFGT